MQVTKILGLVAVGALFALAAPAERANALSLSNPGAAAAVRRIPGWRRRKCTGDITAIIAIIVGITRTTITTVTGTAGERGSLTHT